MVTRPTDSRFDRAGFAIPVIVAAGTFYAILMIQAHVEPDRRVERAVLMQAEPGEIAVEVFAVVGGLKVTIINAPVGNGAGHTVNYLLNTGFPLGSIRLTIEVFADYNVRRQRAPALGNFAIRWSWMRSSIVLEG